MTDSLTIAKRLLEDSRPHIRAKGIEIVADCRQEGVETLFVESLEDPSSLVWKRARWVLRFRQPWLKLKPFSIRPLPLKAIDTPQGKAWQALKKGIEQWLANRTTPPSKNVLHRWIELPGAIPDLLLALESFDHSEQARHLEKKTNLDGSHYISGRQLLACPTYACNLDCTYCYAGGWISHFKSEMSLADLDLLFKWCQQNGIDHVILCGGEPTLYRHFDGLLKKAADCQIRISVTSNTLFPKTIRPFFTNRTVSEFIAHYDQELIENVILARRFEDNLHAVQDAGIPIFLRYTLTEESDAEEWRHLLALADRFGVTTLNYAFAFGNVSDNNAYVHYQARDGSGWFHRCFSDFFAACQKADLHLHLCKPIPLCLLDQDLLRRSLLAGALRSACAAYLDGYSMNLTVNPDLTTFPCNAIAALGPKLSPNVTLRELGHHYQDLLRNLLFKPFFEQCRQCMFFFRGFCQGVCLAEKVGHLASMDKKRLNVLSCSQ